MSLYPHPLAPGYWREALRSFRSLRSVAFSAVMIAACVVLSRFYIPLHESLSLSVTFLARALCALVCGPLAAMVFAVAEDTLSFFLSSGGYPYFPGYALTTLLGCLTYALCFYRARITWRRIILAKTLTNLQNVFLGSLWSAMLYGKGYLYAHDTQEKMARMQCLPDCLAGREYYRPAGEGREEALRRRLQEIKDWKRRG